ncbi:hypothetical protein [Leucobacter sp.]
MSENTTSEDQPQPAESPKMIKATTTYYIAVGALLVGAVVGAMLVTASLSPQLSEARSENTKLRGEVDEAAEEARVRIDQAFAKVEERVKDNEARAKSLDEREAGLDKREGEVSEAEEQKAARELRDGFHTVGKTVEPGVYNTNVGSGMCYYAWKTGTGSDAGIVDNNIVESGPATITLAAGEFIEIKGCGTWTRE